MKALVTGGAGFIGHHIVGSLLARGDVVVVLDDFSTGFRERLDPHAGRVQIIEGSILEPSALDDAAAGCDVVFHEAALASVERSFVDPVRANEVNVGGTIEVVLAAARNSVRRVVFAASSSVYGVPEELPCREAMKPMPESPYGVSKLAGEYYLHTLGRRLGVETVALRYFNVFGPGQDPDSDYAAVIPLFITAVLEGRRPRVNGDGSVTRDFTFVDNVVAANLAAATAPRASGRTLNTACGERTSLLELLDAICTAAGRAVAPVFGPPRRGDIEHSLADISAAREVLGYEVTVPFAEGIKRTVEWYRARVSDDEVRLAFLVGRLARGGAELQMLALARGLTRSGYRVDFVCRSGSGPLDERARAAGATVRTIGKLWPNETERIVKYGRRATRQLRWITTARRERYDIVDAWLQPADIFAALTRPLTRTPVLSAGRRNMHPRPRFGPATRSLYWAVNRLTDVVVANAEITAAQAVREQGVPPERVRVIRAGVELPRPLSATERRAQRAALGAAVDDFLIGSVGTFRTMKRQDLLVDAFARLAASRQDIRLVLVGDGELRPQIESQIERLGLAQRVVLTGTLTDLPPLYAAFDIFVQASNSESLPNVVLEASSASLPIVATAAGGTGEVIHDGETGLLVPVDDLDRMVSAIHRAISDDELRRRMGAAARKLVEREYGVNRLVREYDELYREKLRLKGR